MVEVRLSGGWLWKVVEVRLSDGNEGRVVRSFGSRNEAELFESGTRLCGVVC